MNDEVIARILEAYGCAHSELLPLQKGYRNESHAFVRPDGSLANLIIYKQESGIVQRIQRADSISSALAQGGLPTRCRLDDRTITLTAGQFKKYGAIYNYLPGQTIPWEGYTKHHIKQLGAAMSQLHAKAAELTTELPSVIDEYEAIIQRVSSYFADEPVAEALARKLNLQVNEGLFATFKQTLTLSRNLPNHQPLHMDFVRGNLLFDDQGSELRVSGILDFEKVASGPVVFDVARTLAFLLVDCKYKPAAKVRKYFLVSGYNKRGRVVFKRPVIRTKTDQIDMLEALVDLFLAYDFYKFLRHNPYESLAQNEHFVRTRDQLLQRDLISKC